MINNDALPDIEIDPETHAITVDGDRDHPGPGRSSRWPSCTSSSDARGSSSYVDAVGALTAAVERAECGAVTRALPEPAAGRRPAADRRAHPVGRGGAGASRTGCGWTRCPTTCAARLRTVTEVEAAAAVVARHALARPTRDAYAGACARWTPPGGSGRCPTRCGRPPTCSAAAICGLAGGASGRSAAPRDRPDQRLVPGGGARGDGGRGRTDRRPSWPGWSASRTCRR